MFVYIEVVTPLIEDKCGVQGSIEGRGNRSVEGDSVFFRHTHLIVVMFKEGKGGED